MVVNGWRSYKEFLTWQAREYLLRRPRVTERTLLSVAGGTISDQADLLAIPSRGRSGFVTPRALNNKQTSRECCCLNGWICEGPLDEPWEHNGCGAEKNTVGNPGCDKDPGSILLRPR